MAESEKKKNHMSTDQATISEGESFKNATIPKVVNLDENLRNSYPEGFNEKSKKKRSSRKSVRKHDAPSKSKESRASGSKRSRSASKSKQPSAKKSHKKEALQRKSDRKQI